MMRKTVLVAFAALLLFPAAHLFADDDSAEEKTQEKSQYSKAGESDVPAQKRPRAGSADEIRDLDNTDPDGRKKNADILKFGLEDEVVELLGKMAEKKDVRFVDEAYDLYEESKSSAVKEKIMEFFRTMGDPCLEDYAVMILNDPFDEPTSTVNAAFAYLGEMKTTAAIPAVESLLEGDNEKFYDSAITALGKIGGSDEAMYLAEYFDREELTLPQKQNLVKTLGLLKASETFDKLSEMAQDDDENTFVRMYASEAIGQIGASDSSRREDSLSILSSVFESRDPNLRTYVVKGLSNFTPSDVGDIIIQALKDSHPKVRLEAVDSVKKMGLSSAVPYLVYRAKNDPEYSVKKACWPVIAELNTPEGNEYLVSQITEKKKVGDDTKARVATALLEFNNAGTKEIIALAEEVLKDDHRKPLRYALGKEFAKYGRSEFEEICRLYMGNKDVSTQGTGLDIYAKGRYSSLTPEVQKLADLAGKDKKKSNANAIKAAKILGIDWEAKLAAEEASKKDAQGGAQDSK